MHRFNKRNTANYQRTEYLFFEIIDRYRIRKMSQFGITAVGTYIFVMVLLHFDVFTEELMRVIPAFLKFYGFFGFPSTYLTFLISSGFVLWSIVSFSHVLVSILTAFLLTAVRISLVALNKHLLAIMKHKTGTDQDNLDDCGYWVPHFNRAREVMAVAEEVASRLSTILGVSLITEVSRERA
jgi:hypothetical protein